MTHKFKDEIIDWLNGGEYEGDFGLGIVKPINHLIDFVSVSKVRKVDGYTNNWQPIETSPEDGREFLAVAKINGKFRVRISRRETKDTAKFWMDIPDIPSELKINDNAANN